MDEVTFRGEWWRPADDDNAIAGVLTYTPAQGGELELFGSITDKNRWNANESERIDTIHGEVIEGKQITLKNCHARFAGATIGSVNIQREKVHVDEIFVGTHFNDVIFGKIDVTFPNLVSWTAQSPIRTYYDNDSIENPVTEIDPIDPIKVELDDFEIELKSTPRLKHKDARGTEYIHDVDLCLNSDEPILFEEYRQNIKNLQRYFTLATKQAVYPTEIVGRIERDNDYPDHETAIYYHLPRFSESDKLEIPSRFNFTLKDVSFENSLERWFEHTMEVPTFHELYFNTRYNSDMDVKFLFLALCSAMESLFEHQYPDLRYMDRKSYAELRKNILSGISDEIPAKGRIKSLLESIGNRYSMKGKLEKTTNEHAVILSEVMDVEETIKDIRDTRHDLSHGLGGSLQRAKTDTESLIPLYFKLRIIVETHMFNIIGLDDNEIIEILERHYNLDFLNE